jgi:hypothetical protein
MRDGVMGYAPRGKWAPPQRSGLSSTCKPSLIRRGLGGPRPCIGLARYSEGEPVAELHHKGVVGACAEEALVLGAG